MLRGSNPHRTTRATGVRGFTLIEALIAVVVLIVIAAIGIPALQLMITRSKLSGSAREISIQLASARIAAMRLGRDVVVRPDYERGVLVSFVDEDGNFLWDDGEDELATLAIPGSGGNRGVYLMGPDGVAGTTSNPAQSVDGLTPVAGVRVAVFQPDGSVRHPGGLRLSDAKNPANVFEVRIDPHATARIEVLKFIHGDVDGLHPLGTPTGSWFPQGGGTWEWY